MKGDNNFWCKAKFAALYCKSNKVPVGDESEGFIKVILLKMVENWVESLGEHK